VEQLEQRQLLTFATAVDYSVGTNPQGLVSADFNNDGQLDLATANAGNNSVTVLLGNGQGGFDTANHFITGPSPRAMAAGDFDDDGNLDLATIGFLSAMSVLHGNGDGTFQIPVDTPIHGGSLAVAAGDFNTDGRSDLVYTLADSTNWENPAVAVMLADGMGGFTHLYANELGGAWSPVGLAVGDLNGDGRLDVVTANDDAGSVSVLLGNGNGTLSYSAGSSDFSTGPSPQAVAVGDFTGDGIPDLVAAGQTVDILPGRSGGTFGSPIRHSATSTGITSVAAADFNGDGKLDVVTANPADGTVSLLLGNGNGTLAAPLDQAAGFTPQAIAVGDLNADGFPDVASANSGSNSVSVLLNGVTGPIASPSLRIGDINVVEGNTGTRTAEFQVVLSTASTQSVTVQYATAHGTAAATDYQSASGTITFAPGEIRQTISIAVIGETHTTTLFIFTVSLSNAYDQPVTVSFRTVDGTATSNGGDYVAKSSTLTFLPGQVTKTITIEVKGDAKKEANEVFYVDLFGNSGNSAMTKGRGTGTILNDD